MIVFRRIKKAIVGTVTASRTNLVEPNPRQDGPPPPSKNKGEDRIPPILLKKSTDNQDGPSTKPHSSVCAYDDTSNVAVLTHRHYKAAVTVDFLSREMALSTMPWTIALDQTSSEKGSLATSGSSGRIGT